MEKQIKKFLEFNGKTIYFLSKDATYWIAIKPICEALGIDYNRQFQNIKSDPILKAAFAVQQMQIGNDQVRNWACLPEFYVYGWLFSIRSSSKQLAEYKWKCYDILYNYFHGTITNRKELIRDKAQIEVQLEKAWDDLSRVPEFIQAQELSKKQKAIDKELKSMDKSMFNDQYVLFQN